MARAGKALVLVLLFTLLVGTLLFWIPAQWRECRAEGFSEFYCLQHVAG